MEIITTKEMLADMETGATFSITRIRYDRKRNKGGEIETIPAAKLYTQDEAKRADSLAIGAGRTLTVAEKTLLALDNAKRKDSDHQKWYSRNLVLLQDNHPTSEIRKFHPPLVLEYNGKKVVP